MQNNEHCNYKGMRKRTTLDARGRRKRGGEGDGIGGGLKVEERKDKEEEEGKQAAGESFVRKGGRRDRRMEAGVRGWKWRK